MTCVEPILDESSLVPCSKRTPATRIESLANALKTLHELGVVRVLRSVRDAADRDLGGGRGLRSWCFDKATSKDAGRLVAALLDKQPYIDGDGGLFAVAEGQGAFEAKVDGQRVVGLGLAALTDAIVVALTTEERTSGATLTVELTYLDDKGQCEKQEEVVTFTSEQEVTAARHHVVDRVDRSLPNGSVIVERVSELFSRLRLGRDARTPIEAMTGSETLFRQLVRHLRALDEGARMWADGAYSPLAISFSVESEATLNHGTYGPMRDFAMPDGFAFERWSLHTKMTGGSGARMYFRPERVKGQPIVLVGYFGPHLDTVKHH